MNNKDNAQHNNGKNGLLLHFISFFISNSHFVAVIVDVKYFSMKKVLLNKTVLPEI